MLLQQLPVVRKNIQLRHSNRRVIQARRQIDVLTKRYSFRRTKEVKISLQEAKNNLQSVYKDLEEDEQVTNIENSF